MLYFVNYIVVFDRQIVNRLVLTESSPPDFLGRYARSWRLVDYIVYSWLFRIRFPFRNHAKFAVVVFCNFSLS